MKNLFLVLFFSVCSFTLFAQSNLSGTWNTGKYNTLVKIYKNEAVYIGKIISSDNPKAKIGKLLIKDLKLDNGEWKCQLYAPKRKEWYDAEMEKDGDILEITVSVGFFSKTVEWKKK